MSVLAALSAFAGVGALAATAVHGGRVAYHDGLRPLMPEYRAGRFARQDLSARVWAMSASFVWWFALPFVLVTGIGVSHALFLPADTVGVRASNRVAAVTLGAGVGLLVGGLVVALPAIAARVPADPRPVWRDLVVPLRYLIVLLPVVAAHEHAGWWRAGIVAVVAVVARIASAGTGLTVAGLSPDGVALVAGTVSVVAFALVNTREAVPQPDMLATNLRQARAGLVFLIPLAALAAWLANAELLAGDPGAALLLGGGLRADAAAVALYSTVAFAPMVVRSMAVSGAAAGQGIPDWVLAVGFIAPGGRSAAAAGAAAITAEVLLAPTAMRLLDRRPDLAALGSAMRHSMSVVFDLAVLIGGVVVADRLLEGLGPVLVVGLWLWNEARQRPLMPVAVGALGAIAAGTVSVVGEALG